MQRQPGGQPREATGRARLLARLTHTAADHIVHRAGINARARDELLEHLREQIDGVQLGERTVRFGPCHGAADGIDDDGSVHDL